MKYLINLLKRLIIIILYMQCETINKYYISVYRMNEQWRITLKHSEWQSTYKYIFMYNKLHTKTNLDGKCR